MRKCEKGLLSTEKSLYKKIELLIKPSCGENSFLLFYINLHDFRVGFYNIQKSKVFANGISFYKNGVEM